MRVRLYGSRWAGRSRRNPPVSDHVVRGRPADQVLEQEEGGDDEEEPGGHALGGRQRHGAGGTNRT